MLLVALWVYVGFTKGSVVQWPFSNKVSAVPHLMSFKVSQDEKTKNMMSDPMTSAGFMAISSPDAFDATKKRSAGEIQVTTLCLCPSLSPFVCVKNFPGCSNDHNVILHMN